MSTGNFANWDGNIMDLGPIYPFVGWEGIMVLIGIVFWIGWHIWQIKMENKQLEDEARALRQSGNLQRAVEAEHTLERM
ncbi:MAG TPA: hypothetical protein VG742_01045 [Dongiaceae bacterium]|nr:hypothetical protein [Dongiaceae bacterium]